MADTLMYFKKLEAAGFSRKQAEVQVQMMSDLAEKNFATKEDVKDIRQEMKDIRQEIKDLGTELRNEVRRLETEISRMGDRLTIRLGGMMILGFGALAALIKLG